MQFEDVLMFQGGQHLHLIDKVFIVLGFNLDSFACESVVSQVQFEDRRLVASSNYIFLHELFFYFSPAVWLGTLRKTLKNKGTVVVGAGTSALRF